MSDNLYFVHSNILRISGSLIGRSKSYFVCPINKARGNSRDITSRSCVEMALSAPLFGMFKLPFFLNRRVTVSLPQNDSLNSTYRQQLVRENCKIYKWNQTAIPGASMMDRVPKPELPGLIWFGLALKVIIRVFLNLAINSSERRVGESPSTSLWSKLSLVAKLLPATFIGIFAPDSTSDALESVSDITVSKRLSEGGTLEEHKQLFETMEPAVVTNGNQFLTDVIFGSYRVAGPNPMRLTKCDSFKSASEMFPELTEEIIQGIPGFLGDSMEAMVKENRLYYVSYPEYDGVSTGKDCKIGKQKKSFVYAPSCLLGVPKLRVSDRETVLPLAIRCGQNVEQYPMYTANRTVTDEVAWVAAKYTVQVSDAVIHETVYHFAKTHLLLGIFVCATHRTLPPIHPVYRLLKSHFYGTAFINNFATIALINDGGTIDQLTAPDIYTTRKMAANGANGLDANFNEWFVDSDLARRRVMDAVLPYPYRDDALAIWKATLKWVRAYITAYYSSDADVLEDFELQSWCKELTESEKGNLHGFGDDGDGNVKTVEYLVRAVAHVIFSATAQHAAVNFPQSTMMRFAPAMPLAGYAPAPTSPRPFESVEELCKNMLPSVFASETQLITAELIGVLQYGTLGEYGKSLDFVPDVVAEAMRTFQNDLNEIDRDVQKRNQTESAVGLPVYDHLSPKNIPNSINI